ncbi:RNA polymerase sigma factor [Rhodococcus rhodnii]|uniref:Uncharacterized protein n=2 Tax=Rhodococcus rhodnii TaxID=38312 RepID=R7WQ11_9NOCA|nr:sigma-70 family RNA polymerase sigma factor [Rhodococcus rhodnii]EOM77388.1 hypothetical protein Rrhod_1257 [Rhodococcus rhodnii LMG 5362]
MSADHARFTDIYVRCYPRVLAFARRRAPDSLAREATDEAFLVAWRRLDEVPMDPLPWLLTTARHTLSELRRRGERHDALVDEISRARRLVSASEPGADDAVVERVTVLDALASLRERDRETLMLTVWDGLTHQEAASVSGCTTATFTVRHHRARRRLAAALAQRDGRPPDTALHPNERTPT